MRARLQAAVRFSSTRTSEGWRGQASNADAIVVMPDAIYVSTVTRDDAERLAWSLVQDDVRLAWRGEGWAVRVAPAAGESAETLALVVRRCLERLGIEGRLVVQAARSG